MWNFFLNNSRFTYLLMTVLLLVGVYSVISIPKESTPEVKVPVGIVTTVLPGAPAADVEALITNELERGLSGSLENVSSITSISTKGVSNITVEFDASADIDASIDELKDEVEKLKVDLPSNAEDPVVTEVDFVDQPIFTFALSGNRTDEEFLVLADDLEDELKELPGVSRVETSGVREREVSVLLEQTALLQYGLTVNDVVSAIQTANATFPVGQIITDDVAYNVLFEGDIQSEQQVADVPVKVLGGQPVYVRDVATVQVGLKDASTLSRLSVNGEPSAQAITFNVYKQRGGDITAISAEIATRIEELSKEGELLAGLTTYTVLDAGKDIQTDLSQLTSSGVQTIVLVILVLVVAIGWREGLIAGLSIPLSFTIGFIGLYLSGNTINFISLFALILGIGVLVDSGIVVVEGINARMKSDPSIDKLQAAKLTIQEFSAPLVSGTLTTVSMFVGLFIVSGVTGQFIAGIPFTLIFILFASLLVALGFLPLISATYLRRRNATVFEEKQLYYSHKLEDWYRSKLTWILDKRIRKIRFMQFLFVGFVTSILLIPAGLVKVVFFEQSDVDSIYLELEMPESSINETTDVAMRRVEEVLYRHSDVIEASSITVGSGSFFGSGGTNEKLGNVYIALKKDRTVTSTEFIETLRTDLAELKDLSITVDQPSDGPPTGAAVTLRLLGDDLTELGDNAIVISRALAEMEGATNVKTSTNNNSTELVLTLDKAKTAAAGLNPQVVSGTLRSAVFGADATSLTTLEDDIDVVVRLNLSGDANSTPDQANRTTVNTLQNIELTSPTGERVLLSSLVDISLQESSTAIRHEDQKRVVTVTADVTEGGNSLELTQALKAKLDSGEIQLPDGISYEFGGETEESNKAFVEMFLALIVGVMLMIAVLVLQFDSYRHTFYVLSILPFSIIGILYGLAITGSSLSFPSMLGFIALSGIVVNNSILLIDQMNHKRKETPDLPLRTIVVESAVSRLRPILLTTLTTVIGMVPLLFTEEIWIPLASAIIFGLTFSVIITLVLIPTIYLKYPGTVRSKF